MAKKFRGNGLTLKRKQSKNLYLKEKAHQAFLNLRKFINPSNQGIILTNVDQSCSKLRKVAQSLSKYTFSHHPKYIQNIPRK